jgi:predicted molibdopterin-dependent oxidoreductase YjgC
MALGGNDQGALELGVLPDVGQGEAGLNTHSLLQACADGKIKALWLAGVDPFEAHSDRSLVEKALENVEFLVVQGIAESEAMAFASVVLPMAAPGEQEGSYTNCERRVQTFGPVLSAKGSARPAWRTFSEFLLRANPQNPFFNADEVMDEIAKVVPAYAGATYANLAGDGALLR